MDSSWSCLIMILFLLLQQQLVEVDSRKTNECNIYEGQWVYDPSYPLYDAKNCSFIEKAFNCQNNGRPDHLYTKFRWQPNSCNLPRFNGGDFIRRNQGKRIMFVGDSLSLNQWQSLTCMLHVAEPKAAYTLTRDTKGVSTFTFPAYKFSIMYSRNALLVDIDGNQNSGRTLKLDSVKNGEALWKGVDTLIFNTWHWWSHTGRKQPWDMVEDKKHIHKDMNRMAAYNIALETWAQWVNSNIDSSKTHVFIQGVSPDHMNSSEWGDRNGKTCRGEDLPLSGHKYPGGPHPAQVVLKKVLMKVSNKVKLLDVTRLSQLRKDGHPSGYGAGGRRGNDCTHWCLPGVPDTWNQLLYASLAQRQH